MAVARVVTFDGVDSGRMSELRARIEADEQPSDVPATEIVVLHDRDAERALVVLFFDSEDDYRRGDEALNAMPAEETPGRRASVAKYDVAFRVTT